MPTCPYCGSECVIRDSECIYGRSYGMALVCSRYPQCDSYVGCHRGTSRPLGTPANATLRAARNEAHRLFDPMWKQRGMKRKEAYAWLAAKLGIPFDACHIAMFDLEACRRVVEVCKIAVKEPVA